MDERTTIEKIAAHFTRAPSQRNVLFGCDAEIVEIGGELWGVTLDEFTPEEDLFTSDDPRMLGANLAVATLSDLLAARCVPRFFMQSVSFARRTSPEFLEQLSSGIAAVLKEAGCYLIGGDTGSAETWRFCGMAMGPVQGDEALTRELPIAPQELWVTGRLGDANLACFRKGISPAFELRIAEAGVIWDYATACIDTSGGLLEAVQTLEMLNPQARLDIHAAQIPLADGAADLEKMDIPREAVLMGQGGEYELLFAVPRTASAVARQRLFDIGSVPVGTAAPGAGVFLHRRDGTTRHMQDPLPCPRAMDLGEYIQKVVDVSRDMWR